MPRKPLKLILVKRDRRATILFYGDRDMFLNLVERLMDSGWKPHGVTGECGGDISCMVDRHGFLILVNMGG